MSSVIISGDTSGQVTISAPAVAGSNTLTLQAATATNAVNTLGTAVASTSGTSIDFTGLPSWIKRITVTLTGVSTSGTNSPQIQIGSGSVLTSGYTGIYSTLTNAASVSSLSLSAGFRAGSYSGNTETNSGAFTLTLVGSNIWVCNAQVANSSGYNSMGICAGTVTLSGALDRVRVTTVGSTDTFDAGTVNILYEG